MRARSAPSYPVEVGPPIGPRKKHREPRAQPDAGACGFDSPAVELDELAHDRQAKPETRTGDIATSLTIRLADV
jgi:hypothetical protein